jgi:hypothetical protein
VRGSELGSGCAARWWTLTPAPTHTNRRVPMLTAGPQRTLTGAGGRVLPQRQFVALGSPAMQQFVLQVSCRSACCNRCYNAAPRSPALPAPNTFRRLTPSGG